MPNANSFCNNLGNILRNISNPFHNHPEGPTSTTTTADTTADTTTNADTSHRASDIPRTPNSNQQHRSNNDNNNINMNPFEDFLAHAFYIPYANAYAYEYAPQHPPPPPPYPPETQPHPPASTKSIRQLPTVSVTPEDLVDENNRECCICFEEHHIRDKVSRLPCAHIYHPSCIVQWLVKNNTCPQCRYELPTDNVVYERGREERMKARKPRYAKYELQRMHNKELKELCQRLGIHGMLGIVEKREYIDLIVNSGKVDMIASPDPVEYESIEDLRKMGVSVLKKNMMNAGVFFDPKDVVEKEDMVQIFVNSGRIVFRHEVVEHHDNDEEGEQRRREKEGGGEEEKKMEGSLNPPEIVDPTAPEDTEEEKDVSMTDMDTSMHSDIDSASKRPRIVPFPVVHEEEIEMSHNSRSSSSISSTNTTPTAPGNDESLQAEQTADQALVEPESEPSELGEVQESTSVPEQNQEEAVSSHQNRALNFSHRSTSELLQLASAHQIDLSNCMERQDIIAIIENAVANGKMSL